MADKHFDNLNSKGELRDNMGKRADEWTKSESHASQSSWRFPDTHPSPSPISRRGFLKMAAGVIGAAAALGSGVGVAEIVGPANKELELSSAESFVFSLTNFMENYKPSTNNSPEDGARKRMAAVVGAVNILRKGEVQLDSQTEDLLNIEFALKTLPNAKKGLLPRKSFRFSLNTKGEIVISGDEEQYCEFMNQKDRGQTQEVSAKSKVIEKDELEMFCKKLVEKSDLVERVTLGIQYNDIQLKKTGNELLPEFVSNFISKNLSPNLSGTDWSSASIEKQYLSMNMTSGFYIGGGLTGTKIEISHTLESNDGIHKNKPWKVTILPPRIREMADTRGSLDIDSIPLNIGLDNLSEELDRIRQLPNRDWRELSQNTTRGLMLGYRNYLSQH